MQASNTAPTERQLAYRAVQAANKLALKTRKAQEFSENWSAQKAAYALGNRLAEVPLESLGLDNRTLWLVFFAVEYAELYLEQGIRQSLKTRLVDCIAPKFPRPVSRKGKSETAYNLAVEKAKYVSTPGVSGFTIRYGIKAPLLLRLSHNGFIYPTDLAFELVYKLRKQYPELSMRPTPLGAISVPCLGLVVQHMLWRTWN